MNKMLSIGFPTLICNEHDLTLIDCRLELSDWQFLTTLSNRR